MAPFVSRIHLSTVAMCLVGSVGLAACASPALQAPPAQQAAPHQQAAPSSAGVARHETATPGEVAIETASPAAVDARDAPQRYAVLGVALHDSLHVRKAPDPTAPTLSTLSPTATDIEIVDGPVTVSGSTWVKIQHGQSSGWVNRRYLTKLFGRGPEPLLRRAHEVLLLLTAGEWNQLAALVHPKKGLLFSPSANIDPECLRVSARQLPLFATSGQVRTWNGPDEQGGAFQLTFADYHQRFIIDRDFLRADELSLVSIPDRPNEYNNIEEYFPGGATVEYHLDARNTSVDWSSLRLVFMPKRDTWYLVAIVHVEWTI